MTGRLGGKKGNETRYYAVARGYDVPKSNIVLTRRIPAQPLEDAVLAVVREAIGSLPDLEGVGKGLIEQNARQQNQDTQSPDQIAQEVRRKQKQLALLSDDVELEDDDVLTEKATTIRAQMRTLQQRQREATQPSQAHHFSSDAIAAEIAQEMQDYAKSLDERDNPHTVRLLGLLLGSLVVDLETREFELDISLPSWMGSTLRRRGPMSLDQLTACKPFMQAHPENRAMNAEFTRLNQEESGRYFCRRRQAA